jgi:hypothetical protein
VDIPAHLVIVDNPDIVVLMVNPDILEKVDIRVIVDILDKAYILE